MPITVFSGVYVPKQKTILLGKKGSQIVGINHIPILEVYIAYYHIEDWDILQKIDGFNLSNVLIIHPFIFLIMLTKSQQMHLQMPV